MKVIYISSAVSRNVFHDVSKQNETITSEAVQKYNSLIMQGFVLNNCDVTAISTPPLTKKSQKNKKIYFIKNEVKSGIKYKYPLVVNITGIKVLMNCLSHFFMVMKRTCFRKKTVVICDVLNFSGYIGSYIACKLSGTKLIGVVTDLPEFMDTVGNVQQKVYKTTLHKLSGYVFLTEAMNSVVNVDNKPYTVVEGIVNINTKKENVKNNTHKKKICMYAGGVRKIYGIEMLVKGFIKANIEDTELHIYGFGDYTQEIKKISEKNKQIVFHGMVHNEEVINAQKVASLLINPRPTHESFTKYSFPSKNLEYMASGVPVLTTKLPGMPAEYYPHVFTIDEESEDGISTAITKVFSNDNEQLVKFGDRAKQFVLKNKNSEIVTRNIIDIINRTLK